MRDQFQKIKHNLSTRVMVLRNEALFFCEKLTIVYFAPLLRVVPNKGFYVQVAKRNFFEGVKK